MTRIHSRVLSAKILPGCALLVVGGRVGGADGRDRAGQSDKAGDIGVGEERAEDCSAIRHRCSRGHSFVIGQSVHGLRRGRILLSRHK